MENPQTQPSWKFSDIDLVNLAFLVLMPLVAAVWTPFHIYFNGFDPKLLIFFFIYSIMTSISITAGYHRLFAHRTYEARPWLKAFLLIFGAAAFQNSALKWCTDHRRHHQHVDKPQDPYSIKRGFFFAHMGWIFFKDRGNYDFAPDLLKDPLVRFQHRHYLALAIIFGFVVPMGIGALFHSPFGGLLFGGILRVVFTHHCTFLINSLCHTIGKQPYTDQNSARDSFLMAFFTYGEGYHNFHHQFQIDYRNGIKWYHWDPTKWFIGSLNLIGQTQGLKKVHARDILRAKVEHQAKLITQRGAPTEKVQTLKSKFDDAQNRLRALHDEVKQLSQRFREQNKNHNMRKMVSEKIVEMKLAKVEMKASLKQWKIYAKNWSETGFMVKGF